MAPLPPGIYRIETVPPPGAQSAHAVGVQLDTPVLAVSCPRPEDVESWRVLPVEDSPDQYTIASHGGRLPMLTGWGCRESKPEEQVLFTPEIKNWRITGGEDAAYSVTVPTDIIGATWAVTPQPIDGLEEDVLVIKSYPVIRDMPPLPTWRFIPILVD
ncbi:hypothetical protein MD484_g2260, partial [Candolleomyces efflorescens]